MKKVSMISMAGTDKDFMVSLPTLKAYLNQFPSIKEKYDFKIVNYENNKPINSILEEIAPDVDIVCFSCYIWNMDIFKEVINKLENKTIIVGGPEITLEDIQNGKFDNLKADYFVFGEGEIPFYIILNTLENPKIPRPGSVYKDSKFYYGEHCFLNNLSEQPPIYTKTNMGCDSIKKRGIRFNIETQRGCTFRCSYCLYHKNFPFIRYRNPEVVIEELKFIYANGIRSGRIVDANFFSSEKHASIILKGLLKNNIDMQLMFETNYTHITKELAELCKEYINKGNKIVVGVGLQSLNKESLKSVKRDVNIGLFKERTKLFVDAGVMMGMDLIIGLPHETLDSFKKLITFLVEQMKNTENFLGPNVLRVLPNSDMVRIAKKENLTLEHNNTHFVYETPSLKREHMIECLRLTTVAFRLFSHIGHTSNKNIRNIFFEVANKKGIINTLEYLSINISKHLKLKMPNSDFCSKNFRNAENYYYCKVHNEINDEVLIKMLKRGRQP